MSSQEESLRKSTAPRRPGSLSLGRFFGIPVFVDFTWILIFALLTWTIREQFAAVHPDWPRDQHLIAGVVTSLLFFLCVLLHEMGHSLVARAFGIPVLSITLFVFGGVARIKSEPRRPSHEFLIAIAGPAVSLALAGLFFGGMVLFGPGPESEAKSLPMFAHICSYLAVVNALLVTFNMIPGFPLDGGRVLRSIVWALSGRFELATQFAAAAGSLVAYFFIAGGIYMALFHEALTLQGMWLAVIGLFLLFQARSSVAQLSTRQTLAGLRARDVVEALPYRVTPGLSVQWLVEGPILRNGRRVFMVEADGMMRGMITMQDVRAVPRVEWSHTPLQSIMVPIRDLIFVEPNVPLDSIAQTMEERGIDEMPVVDEDEQIIGIVTREGMHRVLRNRMELGRP